MGKEIYQEPTQGLSHGVNSLPGAYFVTVCTKGRIELFGKVVDGEMRRNDYGNIVQLCWDELPLHYPNIQLDEFQVMPNHVHGIIIIHDDPVGSRHASTLQRQSNVLGDIIGSFKSAATKRINEFRKTPGAPVRQSRFYDHIIRSEKSLDRIR